MMGIRNGCQFLFRISEMRGAVNKNKTTFSCYANLFLFCTLAKLTGSFLEWPDCVCALFVLSLGVFSNWIRIKDNNDYEDDDHENDLELELRQVFLLLRFSVSSLVLSYRSYQQYVFWKRTVVYGRHFKFNFW